MVRPNRRYTAASETVSILFLDSASCAVPDARRAAARGIRTDKGIREEHLFSESDLAVEWEAMGRARMLVVLEQREFLARIFAHVEAKV